MNLNNTIVEKDENQKSITVTREFQAPVDLVWKCYSEANLLDQWWGPAPWKAETKIMKFEEGGHWLYAMVSPEGEKHWGRMNYIIIKTQEFIGLEDAFCDENGNINIDLPVSSGSMVFTKTLGGTLVEFKMTYTSVEQLKAIIEMGFEQGITICLEQLAQLIKSNQK